MFRQVSFFCVSMSTWMWHDVAPKIRPQNPHRSLLILFSSVCTRTLRLEPLNQQYGHPPRIVPLCRRCRSCRDSDGPTCWMDSPFSRGCKKNTVTGHRLVQNSVTRSAVAERGNQRGPKEPPERENPRIRTSQRLLLNVVLLLFLPLYR